MARKPRRKRKGTSNIGRRIKRVDDSIREIGARRITKGPIDIGETKPLTPTREGLRSLGNALAAVQRATKAKFKRRIDERPGLYSYQLSLRFKLPSGKFRTKELGAAGFATPRAVRIWKKRFPKGQKEGKFGSKRYLASKKRLLTEEEAFRDLTEAQIIGAVDRTIESEKDIYGNTEQLLATLKGASEARVRKAMAEFKERRGLTFKVKVRREL